MDSYPLPDWCVALKFRNSAHSMSSQPMDGEREPSRPSSHHSHCRVSSSTSSSRGTERERSSKQRSRNRSLEFGEREDVRSSGKDEKNAELSKSPKKSKWDMPSVSRGDGLSSILISGISSAGTLAASGTNALMSGISSLGVGSN